MEWREKTQFLFVGDRREDLRQRIYSKMLREQVRGARGEILDWGAIEKMRRMRKLRQ
jgi:hypothetical protein